MPLFISHHNANDLYYFYDKSLIIFESFHYRTVNTELRNSSKSNAFLKSIKAAKTIFPLANNAAIQSTANNKISSVSINFP